jgi:hypothetical protein
MENKMYKTSFVFSSELRPKITRLQSVLEAEKKASNNKV